MAENQPARLLVVGGGNMAEAIVRGAATAGLDTVFTIVEPAPARRAVFERPEFRGRVVGTAATADEVEAGPLDQVLLAVKPQSLADAARGVAPWFGAGRRVVISILAGAPSAKIRAALGPNAAVVRVMPNTPARIRQGMSAVALGDRARPGDDDVAMALFGACGEVVRIEERLMDAFTALSGSGPAYVFYLAEAMTRAAREIGFDEATADRVVRQVVAGSGALLAESDQPPAALRAAVTSKGGTTAAATSILDGAGVIDAFVRAIVAARDRGAELARGG